MGWGDIFVGVCLLLIFEGIMPFIAPDKYKEYIKKISETDDNKLRVFGLASMIIGLILLFLFKQ